VGGHTEVVVLHVDHGDRPDEARRLADDLVFGLIALAVDARPELRRAPGGRLAAEIASSAAAHGAELVVLGSRGRSDLGGLRLGAVAHEVLELVTCPVLLVRAGRRVSGRRRRILVAMAGDEDPVALVRAAAAVAAREARVLVLRLPSRGRGGRDGESPTAAIEEVVAGLRRRGVRARVAPDGSCEEIGRTALGYGADLVVVGSRPQPAPIAAPLAAGELRRIDRDE
jgi:nucleotide-binding universal stress UspA family protein